MGGSSLACAAKAREMAIAATIWTTGQTDYTDKKENTIFPLI